VVPGAVVSPGSVEEIQAVVRMAAAGGVAIVASGIGAHLDIGARPRRLDLLVRLDRLARVREHAAADMTVTVEAGCPLATLQATLAAAGQWLPLDPPRPEATTVGGLLAANLSGPLRASQGTARDLLLGLTVVGAEGSLVRGGGRVVKNVAGYDLHKLQIGALGTLGVIVEATFKVRPRPACEEAVVIACRSARDAGDVAQAALESDAEPLWIDAGGPGSLPEGPGDAAAVVVGLGGLREEVAYARARVAEVCERHHVRGVPVADGASLRERLGAFSTAPAAAVLRAATLPARVGETMERIAAAGRACGTAIRCLARAANGVVFAAVADARAVGALVADLRPGLAAAGGSLVVERAAAGVKDGIDVWGDPGQGGALMSGVKHALDPGGVFAPGRFVAGL
jgi:glycolate oxidase FAD binding subunit